MKEPSAPKSSLKPYKSPELTVYGPIRELTLTTASSGGPDHMNRTTTFFT
jgi:hypothetical protein